MGRAGEAADWGSTRGEDGGGHERAAAATAALTQDQAAPSGDATARPPGLPGLGWLRGVTPGPTRDQVCLPGAAAAGARLSPRALLNLWAAPRPCCLCVWGPSAPPSPGPPPQPPSLTAWPRALLAPLPPSGSYQPKLPVPTCPWQAHVQGQGSRCLLARPPRMGPRLVEAGAAPCSRLVDLQPRRSSVRLRLSLQ